MPRGHFIKLLLYVAGIALLMLMKPLYSQLTELTHVPALFEHTLFRVAVAFLVVEAAKQAILITYRPDDPKRKRDNFTTGINHISTIIYGLMLTALVMSLLNISIKEAITTLSLLAAALVVMTKDYIANVINGMYMTFTKTINIGDQVAIGNSRGKILDITLTNIHLLNEDDDIIYIPNNRIFSEEIINYTRRDLKKSSIDFQINPTTIHDIDHLESTIWSNIQNFHEMILPDTFAIKIVNIGFQSVDLKVHYVLKDPKNKALDHQLKKIIKRKLVNLLYEKQRSDLR
jgi:small-conductance mechanosensitive channel